MNLTIINGTWNEVVKQPVTAEVRAELELQAAFKGQPVQLVEGQEFIETVNPKSVPGETAVAAQALYDANKVGNAVDEDVSIDIDEHGGRGIINCRVNGEHVQIRF